MQSTCYPHVEEALLNRDDLSKVRRPFAKDPVAVTRCGLPSVHWARRSLMLKHIAVDHGYWGFSKVPLDNWVPDRAALIKDQYRLRNMKPDDGLFIQLGVQISVLLHPDVDGYELQLAERGEYVWYFLGSVDLEGFGQFIADVLTWNPEGQATVLGVSGGPSVWWWLPYAHWAPDEAKAIALRLRLTSVDRDETHLGRSLPDHAAGAVLTLLREGDVGLARAFIGSRGLPGQPRLFRWIEEVPPRVTPDMVGAELRRRYDGSRPNSSQRSDV